HADTSRAVRAERLLLRSLGGGCLSAVGAYASVAGDELVLEAVVLGDGGGQVLRARARGVDDAEVVRQITARLEGEGSARLLRPGPSGGPLAGLRVMVTRADDQAQSLTRALEAEGATAIACPVIAIEPIEVEAERLAALDGYEWAVFTSANGVDRLLAQLQAAGRVFPTHIKVAAIGPQPDSNFSMSFPTQRPRRLRGNRTLRRLARETRIAPQDLIYPLFVRDAIEEPQPIESMPGQVQHTLESLTREAETALKLGVRSLVLFGIPGGKDPQGSGAWIDDGIVQRPPRQLRDAFRS